MFLNVKVHLLLNLLKADVHMFVPCVFLWGSGHHNSKVWGRRIGGAVLWNRAPCHFINCKVHIHSKMFQTYVQMFVP